MSDATPGVISKAEAERRLRLAQAELAEDDLKKTRGDLIPYPDFERNQIALVQSFVSALENMPARVVPLLLAARGHQEMMAILQDHIRTMRIQLSAKHSPRKMREIKDPRRTSVEGCVDPPDSGGLS